MKLKYHYLSLQVNLILLTSYKVLSIFQVDHVPYMELLVGLTSFSMAVSKENGLPLLLDIPLHTGITLFKISKLFN